MKWLLILALLTAGPLRSETAPVPSVREKLRARIVETLPAPLSAWPAETKPAPDEPVLVLEPMVVAESKGVKELAKVIEEDKQRQEAERFTALKGGKIYSSERLDVGGWWSPATGWTFLKIKW